MKKFRIMARVSALAAIGLLGLYACSSSLNDSQTSSIQDQAWQNQMAQDETPALLEGLDIEAAYTEPLLTQLTGPVAFAKPAGVDRLIEFAESNEEDLTITRRRWILKAQTISAEDGGVIEFGTDDIGYSRLEVPPGALNEDTQITIIHKLIGKRDIFFFDDGLVFNEPVTLKFSLDGLSKRQKSKLINMRLYYHNPQAGGWELIESSSDGVWVTAKLEHFSRYAIGSDAE